LFSLKKDEFSHIFWLLKSSFGWILSGSLFLQLPEHLDGIDDADIGVVEVVECTEGEGRHNPDESLAQVRN